MKYLLPCRCGKTIPVEPSQAGQQVRCVCGAQLEVPPMLAMSRLAPAETSQSATGPTVRWGTRQRLILVGTLITVIGLLGAFYLHTARPRLSDPQRLSAREAWQLWQEVDQGLDQPPTIGEERFVRMLKAHRRWVIVFWVVAGLGALVLASSLFVPCRALEQAKHLDERPTS